jgi:HSP20 family protein
MAGRYGTAVFLRLQAELDRLFQEALEVGQEDVQVNSWQPAIDIVETVSTIVILVESPGCSAADLKVEVKGPLLRVTGCAVAPSFSEVKYLRLERSQGRFMREIQLLWPVNSHAGSAVLAGGLLTIEFPKIADKRHAGRQLVVKEVPAKAGSVVRTTP